MKPVKTMMIKQATEMIEKLEKHIADNKEKINDVNSPEWLRKLLIDDNNHYLQQLKGLNEELNKWKK